MPWFHRTRRGIDPGAALASDGFAIIRDAVDALLLSRLREVCDVVPRAGIRNLFDAVPESRDVAGATPIASAVRRVLGTKGFVTRAILFDKGEVNWSLPWHQDTVIAVQRRVEAKGYAPWSVKDGIPHVRPPREVLEAMLTVRLHVDDADERNGALKILPGTHTEGVLDAERIDALQRTLEPVVCTCAAGDALLMRPLLLHASSRSDDQTRRRRVVHLEFAAGRLPGRVQWAHP